MEKNKQIKVSLGAVVSGFIIMILIIALGIVYYLGIVKNNEKIIELKKEYKEVIEQLENEKRELQEGNESKEDNILVRYQYDVPQEVRDENGNYYNETFIELLTDKTFKYYYGEGSIIKGVFQREGDNLICYAKTIEGDYLEKQEINVKYTFKYSDNTLELINKEGKVKFETTDYGLPGIQTEIKEIEEVHEQVGSIYVITTLDSNKTQEGENTQSTTDKISDSEIDEIAKNLFEKGSQKIRETEYTDYYQYESAQPLTEKIINGVTYQKRNVLYTDVEKEYSEIFTGDALKNVLGKRFADIDGYLYVSYGGATGWNVTNIKVSGFSESNNEIEYTVTYNDVNIDDSISEESSCKMIVKLVDGNYKISEINYCNIDKSF